MSGEHLDPLEDDILAHLAAAKGVEQLEPERKAAILAVAIGKIGTLPPGGGDGGGGGAGAGAGAGAKMVAALGVVFVLGVGVGVMVDRSWGAEVKAPVAVVKSEERRENDAGVRPAEIETVTAASLPDAPKAKASAAPSAKAEGIEVPSSKGLAAERALLDVARSSLARGEAGEALVATSRHAREYPDGSLVEEREAIAIKSLVALGRKDEARARAKRHEERFPNGLTLRAVKAAAFGPP